MTSDPRPIEEWADQELLDRYRHALADLTEEPSSSGDKRPAGVILAEMRRRGLPVPADPSLSIPGRDEESREETGRPHDEYDEMEPEDEEPPLIG